MERKRIHVLDIPIDVLPPGTFESAIQELLLKVGPRQIIFLSVWDLLKARGKNDFAQTVKNADLVIPISKSIVKGAVFLNQTAPERYNPFEAIISILYTLDAQNRSLYILGGKKKVLMEAERNVRATFPSLRIVGCYIGHYPQSMENDIISAIRKASPSVILLSEGIPDKKNWYYRRRAFFSNSFTKESSIFVHYPEAVGVFSKNRQTCLQHGFRQGFGNLDRDFS
ncbi:MAG: WecB/TagA/CpsF family glycosyltransferase [Treponemataceae bacterium]|nr:MAG: WecB/TagA/CpsF family glycosyltransferase [Treponemataceae bacterium]